LTSALLPALIDRRGSRVVTLSSLAHRAGVIRFSDLDSTYAYEAWSAYNQSKLANLLFALELDRRSRAAGLDVASLGAHPGIARTELGETGPQLGGGGGVAGRLTDLAFRLFGQSPETGALPVLFAATSADAHGGDFIGPSWPGEIRGSPVRVRPARQAADPDAAALLWRMSEELTGAHFESLDVPSSAP
ncbi:MAG: short-chain dehydrogenase, partial [Candidatus Limnocylindrales bacterium]